MTCTFDWLPVYFVDLVVFVRILSSSSLGGLFYWFAVSVCVLAWVVCLLCFGLGYMVVLL